MARWRDRPAAKAGMLVLGVALLGVALWYALGRDWQASLAPLARANPWLVVALAGAVVAQLVLTGLLFWAVTLSFDARPAVSAGRMIQIISASSLLNYLPLEAGLIGRAAYLKWRHALPLRQSVLILLVVIALSTVVPGVAVAIALMSPAGLAPTLGVAALLALCALTPPVGRMLLQRPIRMGLAWAPLRAAELLVGALRLWLAFVIVGQPTGYTQVLIAAAAGFFISLLSPTPNGLGLREWAIAGLSTLMSPQAGPAAALASLVDRAIEAGVFVVAGLWSVHRLRREGERAGLQPVGAER